MLWALISKQSCAQVKAAIMKSQRTNQVLKMHWFTKPKCFRVKTYLWMKICSMVRGYKYVTFIVVLVYVLDLCSVSFGKVFASSGKPRLVTLWQWQEWCHQQKISLFSKCCLDFGKLAWASCSNRFCLLSPLLYSFLNLLRIQEQLRLWNHAQLEPKTPIISLIILSSLHRHSNKHSTSLCTIYWLNRTFFNDSTILKTFCFLF